MISGMPRFCPGRSVKILADRVVKILTHPFTFKFLAVLLRLGCEVRSGKGSETTVYRFGGKKYRLGQNSKVGTVLVKEVLKRLGISHQEWFAAV